MRSTATAPDTAQLAAQLEQRIARAIQVLRGGAQHGRSVASLLTLRRLDEHGPLRITDLAAAELVSQPSMTGLVQRLEHDGLVVRTRDPDDARAVRVQITPAGRDELAGIRSARAAALESRLARLDDDARAALAAAIPALDDLLDA